MYTENDDGGDDDGDGDGDDDAAADDENDVGLQAKHVSSDRVETGLRQSSKEFRIGLLVA